MAKLLKRKASVRKVKLENEEIETNPLPNPPPLQNTEVKLEMVLLLTRLGATLDEIAGAHGMPTTSFTRLVERNGWYERVVEARESPDHQVESSLFRRAVGYQIKEIKQREGKPVEVTIRDVPPDVIACIFWLKNRRPEFWRDQIDVRFSLKDRVARAHEALDYQKKSSLIGNEGVNDDGNAE